MRTAAIPSRLLGIFSKFSFSTDGVEKNIAWQTAMVGWGGAGFPMQPWLSLFHIVPSLPAAVTPDPSLPSKIAPHGR